MRYLLLSISLACACTLSSQNINVSFLGKMTYGNQKLANLWGYASDGNEYALVGTRNGFSIEDVTNPSAPTHIVQLSVPSSDWREIKTYQNYAYSVSEGGGGVFIVDLTELPNAPLQSDYHNYYGDGAINGLLLSAHALHVDETEGFLYVYGSQLSNSSNLGRPLIFDLADPFNPVYVGVYTAPFTSKYVHDGYADGNFMYSAHIFEGKVAIVDMTNKNSPNTLATFTTPNAFPHNTWRNGNYLFTTDEVSGSFLTAYDISDLDDVIEVGRIQSNPGSGSIVHNTYIQDDYAITSWYKDGFTIVDVSRPENLVQVGNYDTYPNDQGNGFSGCWGVYPYLPSGNILASNITNINGVDGELWILDPSYVRACYLEGKITKASDGTPLQAARIEVLSPPLSVPSNAGGFYKTGWHESGDFDVKVSKTGYQTWNGTVTLSHGVVTTLNVALLAPAAVEMLRFDAVVEGNGARLTWATATERDNQGFEVQHSIGATGHWQKIGFVPGRGDSDLLSEYSFDVQNLPPGRHFFRLRQIDFDGKETLTDVKTIQIRNLAFQAEMLPNATSNRCTLHLFSEKPMNVTVEILDVTGYRMGISWDFEIEKEIALPIDASILPAGVYYAHIITEIGDDEVVRWVKK
ncbi:MAG: choice-of-anchor B family protein [Phycisphaerae bacterium]|nr:choice-of-anchor B family protein [Saprospiraceae bacterium]